MYQRELMFILLQQTYGSGVAMEHAANMTPERWNAALAEVRALRAKDALPVLYTGLPEVDGVLERAIASNFIVEEYQYKDLVTIHDGDVVLDCGGFCGETAVWALQKGAAKVYTFEPSPKTIPHIKDNIKALGEQERIILIPCAVGAELRLVSFLVNDEGLGGSHVRASGGGTISVQQIVLDAWCKEHNVVPDFIKMDIEGAEVDAIKGASHIIAQHKPRLAICLYHRSSDMWVIPTMLKELCPEYRFWCKKNAIECEFVLYASI